MNAKEITRLLFKARKAESAMREVLEAAEDIGLGFDAENELLRSKTQITKRVNELEAELWQAKEAEEEERLANRRKVTIRRREWDADDKVTVEIVPGKFYGQEVYYKGERLGLVDGKKAGEWTASPVGREYSRRGLHNRAEAIRVLVANAER